MNASQSPDLLSDDVLSLRLRALGHPARLAILRELARADRCQCGEIVRVLPLAQSTVSEHLKVLKEAGLVTGTVEGPRSCYCLDRAALAQTVAALGPLLAVTDHGTPDHAHGAAMRPVMLDAGASDPICTRAAEQDPSPASS